MGSKRRRREEQLCWPPRERRILCVLWLMRTSAPSGQLANSRGARHELGQIWYRIPKKPMWWSSGVILGGRENENVVATPSCALPVASPSYPPPAPPSHPPLPPAATSSHTPPSDAAHVISPPFDTHLYRTPLPSSGILPFSSFLSSFFRDQHFFYVTDAHTVCQWNDSARGDASVSHLQSFAYADAMGWRTLSFF